MHQNPLKILCAYHDLEPDWLGVNPEEELKGHHVTVVHSYHDARNCIIDTRRGIPSFDIILADVTLPGGFEDDLEHKDFPFPTVMLQPYIDQALIRGFGIFVPRHYESVFDLSDGYSVVSASKECWTPLDKRDWAKLLELVIKTSGEADRFNVREPEEGTS